MEQSISPNSKLPNLDSDDKTAGQTVDSETQLPSPRQQSLMGRVGEKHLGFTSDQGTTAGSETDGSEACPPQPPLTTRVWQGANALKETVIGVTAVGYGAIGSRGEAPSHLAKENYQEAEALQQHLDGRDINSSPDDLLSGKGKSWGRWAVDQVKYVADGVASKSLSDELLPKEPEEGDGKTWSQWATENAIAAKDVAAVNAIKVKNTAATNVKYVTDAASSKLPSITGPAPGSNASNYNVTSDDKKSVAQTVVDTGIGLKDSIASKFGYGADQNPKSAVDMEQSVEDVVNRYSTARKSPEAAQKSVTKSLIDTGLGLKDGIATQLGYGPHPDSQAAARAATVKEHAVNRATTLKESTVSVLIPGNGEKDLSKTITDSLSNLPTLLKDKVWVSSSGSKAITSSDDMLLSTNFSSSPENSASTPPTGGIVNRVAGVVSSASGVVSSYLPTSVASYLPGRKSPQHENLESPSETTSSTEVTFKENLDQIGLEKLMEVWTIGNETPEWTINSGTLDQYPDAESCLSPQSPNTPKSAYSASVTHRNMKAEAIAEAHRARVTVEATAYLEAELRKAEAHAQKLQAKAYKHRLDEEAKAIETLKKEELRAGLVVHNAEVKVEKILAQSKSRAVSIGAAAEENYAKNIADAKTKAERWKAGIEETKQREMAELRDRVEHMILMEELPAPSEHKGVVQKVKDELVHKVKEKVLCHLRGY